MRRMEATECQLLYLPVKLGRKRRVVKPLTLMMGRDFRSVGIFCDSKVMSEVNKSQVFMPTLFLRLLLC
jgi:hypothetical protein